MKKIRLKMVVLVLCVGMLAMFVSGCVSVNFSGGGVAAGVTGRGELETFTFDVGEITELRVALLSNVEFFTTDSDTVTLEIQSNLMDYVTVEESGGVLTVRSTRNINWAGADTPVLTIGSSVLSRVNLAGAGNFTAHDTIAIDSFSIDFAGAGNAVMDLDVENVFISVAGAGNFTLSGNAENADVSLSGAGRVEALELQTRFANVNMAGAGTVRISCSERLVISAAGVGTVEYSGNPSLDISRGGLVTVRNVD
jgi:hypothetical protein